MFKMLCWECDFVFPYWWIKCCAMGKDSVFFVPFFGHFFSPSIKIHWRCVITIWIFQSSFIYWSTNYIHLCTTVCFPAAKQSSVITETCSLHEVNFMSCVIAQTPLWTGAASKSNILCQHGVTSTSIPFPCSRIKPFAEWHGMSQSLNPLNLDDKKTNPCINHSYPPHSSASFCMLQLIMISFFLTFPSKRLPLFHVLLLHCFGSPFLAYFPCSCLCDLLCGYQSAISDQLQIHICTKSYVKKLHYHKKTKVYQVWFVSELIGLI